MKLDAYPFQTKKENKEKLNTYKIPLVSKKIINIKSMLIKTITILLFSLSPFLKEPCVKIGTAGAKWSMKKNCYIVTIPDEKETKTHRGIDGIKWMDDWHVIGPFPSGSRELGMDPFLSFDDISKKEFNFEKSYPSELVDGGMISWKKIKSKNDEIQEGAIYCAGCERYFLIIEEIPVMLPDELRDKKQENEFLQKNKDSLPEKIIKQGKPWHL